ncbi:cell division initiation protein [Thermanaeromonas toyohensis ToBE]|uniref:Cell division initiation protein n=1 Tax=Thermanaeromonas toyohensis ToBE TaxID=698762 RepID=A0A1W1VNA0_9FIRM|nr:DivIVA domain-containing protein [Thermanaeromonas toyohensis]SMB94434.1 cell division initiation protein [Thermanaeromonas toyohensis ToBE]
MVLTPLDINKKEFRRSFRGYSCPEVDEFLEQLLRDYTQVFRENQELRDKVLRLQEELERFTRLENTLKETLVVAQRAAEETRENARRESEALLKETEAKAQEIMNQALNKVAEAERRLASLEEQARTFKTRLRSFLLAQLKLLESEIDTLPVEAPEKDGSEGTTA